MTKKQFGTSARGGKGGNFSRRPGNSKPGKFGRNSGDNAAKRFGRGHSPNERSFNDSAFGDRDFDRERPFNKSGNRPHKPFGNREFSRGKPPRDFGDSRFEHRSPKPRQNDGSTHEGANHEGYNYDRFSSGVSAKGRQDRGFSRDRGGYGQDRGHSQDRYASRDDYTNDVTHREKRRPTGGKPFRPYSDNSGRRGEDRSAGDRGRPAYRSFSAERRYKGPGPDALQSRPFVPEKDPVNAILTRRFSVPEGHELVYGVNPAEAVFSGSRRRVFGIFCKKEREESVSAAILRNPRLKGLHPEFRTDNELTAMTGSPDHQGLVVETETFPVLEAEALWADMHTFKRIVAFDEVQDPQNVGSVIRSGLFFGVDAFITTKRKSAPINATVAKTSAGNVENARIYEVTNLSQAMLRLKSSGFWVIGADSSGQDISTLAVPEKYLLVLGNEGSGLRELTAKNCDLLACIPGSSQVESLNVSAACSVLLYRLSLPGSGTPPA